MARTLNGIRYRTEVPSAQIKSAILLAGLQADGMTVVEESAATRNHTELALRAFGATRARSYGNTVQLAGGQSLRGGEFVVPGDISSAASGWPPPPPFPAPTSRSITSASIRREPRC